MFLLKRKQRQILATIVCSKPVLKTIAFHILIHQHSHSVAQTNELHFAQFPCVLQINSQPVSEVVIN